MKNLRYSWTSLVAQMVKSACNAGELDLIIGSGRSPGEGNGNPLQYSCLKIPWMEEPGGWQSIGFQRVGHDWSGWAHRPWIKVGPFSTWDFPGGAVPKNTPANAGDPGLIPGLGRSPGGGNGNPLQYSCLKIPWTEEPGGLSPWGCKESDMTEWLTHIHDH